MQRYHIRRVYASGVHGSISVRDASRYFLRGHHLYDQDLHPIEPIQYHGRGAFQLQPSMNPNHPPYVTTINDEVHNSNSFLGEAQEVERAQETPVKGFDMLITSNTAYRTPGFRHSRSIRTRSRLSVSAPVTVHGSPTSSVASTHQGDGSQELLAYKERMEETQQLIEKVRGDLGWVEHTPAIAVEGPGNRFIIGRPSSMKKVYVTLVAVSSIKIRIRVETNGEADCFGRVNGQTTAP
ncbi:hypothetical protein AOQ84DRAFT_363493 [Glonium stellatum]|uniref:Uncharacterized protein n=1 Tax=Glonium stellatum TaxID=574774 RepID=A0A8E2F272_9PEZI|nr:hypothetical protein AOQ84DRAFT_363493 [Glonium stellatum]